MYKTLVILLTMNFLVSPFLGSAELKTGVYEGKYGLNPCYDVEADIELPVQIESDRFDVSVDPPILNLVDASDNVQI